MGRKSRNRKQSRELRAKQAQQFELVTLFEFARMYYQKLGRGMIVHPGIAGATTVYAPKDQLIDPEDPCHVFVDTYNPETQFALHHPIDLKHQDGAWTTKILTEDSPENRFRVGIPKEAQS